MPEQGAVADKPAVVEPVDSVKEPVDHAPPPAEPEKVPSSSEGTAQQGLPSFAQPTIPPAPTVPAAAEEPAVAEDTSVPAEPAESLEPVEPVESVKPLEPAEPAGPLEPAKTEVEPPIDANEKSNAWLETLREAAKKRREESTASRKRAHDEPEESQPSDGPKAAKISKPEAPPPRKSMALSSIKPLPTLPILGQINSTLARKPTEQQKPEPPKPKPSHIDEDELLLSAARIAAESLRSGPRLTESWPSYYSEPPRSTTFSPASSFSSSMPPLSGSQSPHQSPQVNGHDLALAPDDLGLGRTLSRTEQRLRLTGGKGLAYKPLDFTPEKKKRKSFGR